jgi:predicted metalloprotease
MSRLGVLSFALLLIFAAPASLAAQEAPAADDVAAEPVVADAYADPVVADVNAFWAGLFAVAGVPYAAPGVAALAAPVTTGCGWIDPAWGPAAYCPAEQTIYVSGPWYAELQAAGDGITWTTVLAHEWGHHIQLLLGVPYTADGASELQADCLSGAYTADAEARGLLAPGAVAHAIGLSVRAGDPLWLPADAPVHGSGADRARAFWDGYREGIADCGIAL